MTQNTEELLAQRKTTHGEYADHAATTQALLDVAHAAKNWPTLPPMIRETIHMVFHKYGRVLTGNPYLKDHYDDASGYSVLVSQRINDAQDGMKPWPPEPTDAEKLDGLFASVGATVLRAQHTEAGERAALQGEALKCESSLGTEPLTRERLAAAVAHAVNCCGYDAASGTADHVLGERVSEVLEKYRLESRRQGRTLWTAAELNYALSCAVLQIHPKLEDHVKFSYGQIAHNLLPYVLDHLRGTTGVQITARVEELGGERSAYSALYDAMAREFDLPRHEVKRRFLRAMFHPAGVLGGEGGAGMYPEGQPASWLLDRAEDGSEVHFSSYSGGASTYGAWGQIALRFSNPGNPAGDKIRVYREERDALDVVFDALGLARGESLYFSASVENMIRGQSYSHVSHALQRAAENKAADKYDGSSAQFAAHVFVLARMLATTADRGGTTLGGYGVGGAVPSTENGVLTKELD